MNKEQFTRLIIGCRKYAPEELKPRDILVNFGATMLQSKVIPLALKGYTDDEISEIVESDVEVLNKLLKEES